MRLQFTTQYLCALALLVCGVSCRQQSTPTNAEADGEGDLASPLAQVANADLFDPPRVLTFNVTIPDDQLKVMQQGSYSYGRCTFSEGGASYNDVGIRYKGNPAKEAASGKPDFTVEFNEFVSGQKFRGLRRLILLAGRDDPSYLAAPIGLELFREAGVPSARCTFSRLQLNGRDLGLYLVVEGVDRTFIRRHFARSNGNLYDEARDTDVDGKLEKYGGRNNPGQPDVDALAAATRESDPARRWSELQRQLDMERFLNFTALEVLLWMKDSYAITANKFRIYHDPVSDRMVFFPKNVEDVLGKTNGPVMPQWRGLVAKAVLSTPEGQQQYRQTVARLLDTVFKPDKVQKRAREIAATIRPAAAGTDPDAARKFDAAVLQFCNAVDLRARFVSEQLKALPPTKAPLAGATAGTSLPEE
jgi:spore coat protein CotH